MPYRRRKPSRPSRRRRPTTARKVAKLSKVVMSMKNAEERKFLDALPATAALTQVQPTGSVAPVIINQIAPGDDVGERNANKVLLQSIQFDVIIAGAANMLTNNPQNTNQTAVTLTRFLAVWFPGIGAATASQLTLDNVLEDPRNIQSFYKRDGAVNYKVLLDRKHNVDFNLMWDGTSPPIQITSYKQNPLSSADSRFKKIIPLKKQCTYDGATVLPNKGVLCYYLVGEPMSGTIVNVTARVNSRLTWTDD